MRNIIIDRSSINNLHEIGGNEFVVTMIDSFKKTVNGNREVLKLAYGEMNFETIRKTAHALKTSSGNLGAVKLYDFVSKLENDAKKCNENEVIKLFENIDSVIDESIIELEKVKETF